MIAELQGRWHCELHSSKGREAYCWNPPDARGICYVLSLPNITYWAIDIVSARVESLQVRHH
jgi:hypothetical protein